MMTAWLVATLLGVSGVGVLLAGTWTISTYYRLARLDAPSPGRIVAKLVITPIASALPVTRPAAVGSLVGRRAWIWWDLRWGPSGQSAAIVRSASGNELHLSLDAPILCPSEDGGLLRETEVRFTTVRPPSWRWRTVSGVVDPVDSPRHHGDPAARPRARVCVV